MSAVVISGTGLFTPPESISNDELVASFNAWVSAENERNAERIASGEMQALQGSSSDFILRASGIKSRFVMEKKGALDPQRMCPNLPTRGDDELSLQAEISWIAAKEALDQAGKTGSDVDGVIVACSNVERAYPAVAIEIQAALGAKGFAFDMNVACSSATFAIQLAADSIRAGHGKCFLVVNPEICSGHLNWCDRDSHFIFGDVCTVSVVESKEHCTRPQAFEIMGSKLTTQFSNNIRNNFSYLNRTRPEIKNLGEKLFYQQGKKVFKEVSPLVAQLITEHLQQMQIPTSAIKRMYLHQANLNMNHLIGKRVLGREPEPHEAPVILDEYANTSSAGVIIAFHKFREDLQIGDQVVMCSFGAGYSIGNLVLQKVALTR